MNEMNKMTVKDNTHDDTEFFHITLSNDSRSTILFPRTTTMPIDRFSPDFVSSMLSSTTRFMKGSKPRRMPVTILPPFSFRVSFFSMYFFNSGGCALLIVMKADFSSRPES
eukprot:GHVL01023913.1.p1 GENE.GHVL01023913.1~~GHVL01023913.1.p1  ORF type:complete len:111 (-),score=2.59 GHVL01023913.1:152-484(-)